MFKLSWIAIIVFLLDQATKWLALERLIHHAEVPVTSFFNLTLVFNSGAAFGFLNNASGWQNLFFVVVAIIVSLFILSMIKRLGANDTQVAVALMLILGGAIGNVVDRVRLGYVVDFIDIYYGSWHWPVFNIADSAITLGVIIMILDMMGLGFRKKHS